MQVRQGDVLVCPCDEPEGEKTGVEPRDGRLILAEGEATGHAHAVRAEHAVLCMVAGVMYLRALRETQLLHEEHSPVDIEPGWHRVIRQREYAPGEIRSVQD